MEYLVTSQEMSRADRNTIEQIGIPAMVLMERAAYAVWEELRLRCPREAGRRVLVLAGVGNNGADGLALARILADNGYEPEVLCCGNRERATEQWKAQYSILGNYPVKIVSKPEGAEYNILIDALFGVGLSREVQGEYAEAIRQFNQLRGYKIAVDIPSGIDADSGKVLGCAVRVNLTVTFAFAKKGLYGYPGAEYAGQLVVKDIGICVRSFLGELPELFHYREDPFEMLPPRSSQGNKGTFGKVLLIAGDDRMAGAAVLAARSAGRTGAGMVRVITPRCNRDILLTSVPEALCTTAEDLEQSLDWADVIAIGPGLGTGEYGRGLLLRVLDSGSLPLVIDADGLNLLAGEEELARLLAEQAKAGRTIILTPHRGELARLLGRTIAQVQEQPEQFAKTLAQHWNCVIVSKDARTFICRASGPSCLNTSGNSGMATAGSGDVLTGIIAGLLAQGMAGFEAASVGAYLHGLAGDAAAASMGPYAVMAEDIVHGLTQIYEYTNSIKRSET